MSGDPLVSSDAQRDRAIGALLGMAAGDALAGTGGDPLLGRWSHPTAMALSVAEFTATGVGVGGGVWQDRLVERWDWWARTADDVGPQTAAVLAAAPEPNGHNATDAAAAVHRDHGRNLDGSCLSRVIPAALAGSPEVSICALTHAGPDAAEACQLWSAAVRHAVSTGRLDIRIGLARFDSERRELWESRIAEAGRRRPDDFAGVEDAVVAAFQSAWSAIATTPVPDDDAGAAVFAVDHLRMSIEAALAVVQDVRSVAAAAGGLLGAAYGATAVPSRWRLQVKGWPGLNTHLLSGLAERIISGGEVLRVDGLGSRRDCAEPQRHPHDDGVWIGEAARLQQLPAGVGAVVSLCPISDGNIPAGVEHLEVRLIDNVGANPNLDFVLLDTVRAIERWRAEGIGVFVHGRATYSRAPAVAALYGARRVGIDADHALADITAVLPGADPNREFRAALRRLHPSADRNPTNERAPR